jgi:hypothetical protein
MYIILIILFSLALSYVAFLAVILITALLFARHEIRKHHEGWRFSCSNR